MCCKAKQVRALRIVSASSMYLATCVHVHTCTLYLCGPFKVRFERWLKVVLQNNNIGVSHSIHLVDLLQALLAVFNALL